MSNERGAMFQALYQSLRDKAQRKGIDAYYNYLAKHVPAHEQDQPWAITNALIECVNAAVDVVVVDNLSEGHWTLTK